jgi:TM2 domain-containing membrane protein YozV/Tfp pilus assembly major pilin PilA
MNNNMVTCRGCGKEIHQSAVRCPHCGASQLTSRYKSKLTAGLLAIFIGGLGIHRFYLGQWWGLFYLLFWITGIPSLVSIIEGIVFLASNDYAWDEKHNRGVHVEGGAGGAAVVLIVVVVMVMVGLAVIGILAAIAIPAYNDFIVRAKVAGVVTSGAQAKAYVEDYTASKRAWPAVGEVISLPEPGPNGAKVTATMQENGVVVLTINDKLPSLDGKSIEFQPDISGEYFVWSCTGGTLEKRYRPAECRGE